VKTLAGVALHRVQNWLHKTTAAFAGVRRREMIRNVVAWRVAMIGTKLAAMTGAMMDSKEFAA
jgi:uncharacterized alpha-E superfamily protein